MTIEQCLKSLEDLGTFEKVLELLESKGIKNDDVDYVDRCTTCPLAQYILLMTGEVWIVRPWCVEFEGKRIIHSDFIGYVVEQLDEQVAFTGKY